MLRVRQVRKRTIRTLSDVRLLRQPAAARARRGTQILKFAMVCLEGPMSGANGAAAAIRRALVLRATLARRAQRCRPDAGRSSYAGRPTLAVWERAEYRVTDCESLSHHRACITGLRRLALLRWRRPETGGAALDSTRPPRTAAPRPQTISGWRCPRWRPCSAWSQALNSSRATRLRVWPLRDVLRRAEQIGVGRARRRHSDTSPMCVHPRRDRRWGRREGGSLCKNRICGGEVGGPSGTIVNDLEAKGVPAIAPSAQVACASGAQRRQDR